MKNPSHTVFDVGTIGRWTLGLATAACLVGLPMTLAACNDSESHSKTTTTKTVDTPTEKTKTTTTNEKKTEVEKKEP